VTILEKRSLSFGSAQEPSRSARFKVAGGKLKKGSMNVSSRVIPKAFGIVSRDSLPRTLSGGAEGGVVLFFIITQNQKQYKYNKNNYLK